MGLKVTILVRVLAAIAAFAIGWVALPPASVAASTPAPAIAFDAPHYGDADHDTASHRGPPAPIASSVSTDGADDFRSYGSLVRLLASEAVDPFDYDGTPRLVQIDSTAMHGGGDTGALSSLPAFRVAAKSGDDTIGVGRWMGEDEFAKMSNSGRVIEGGGGRTYVTNPANPDAYPAGKGIFAEFNVPRDSVFPASKPEWGVIPGPNVPTTRYGPPPTEMPPATRIVLVCRR